MGMPQQPEPLTRSGSVVGKLQLRQTTIRSPSFVPQNLPSPRTMDRKFAELSEPSEFKRLSTAMQENRMSDHL